MSSDKIPEVRISFLNSALITRPYFEKDVDLFLKFNNCLNTLQLEASNIVCEVAKVVNEDLRRNKN